jgi:phosphosulfolactate synthase
MAAAITATTTNESSDSRRRQQMQQDALAYPKSQKPKHSGITMVIDKLYGLQKEEFNLAGDYVDIVEIGWGLPLLWKKDAVKSRISFYHQNVVKVSLSGTLIEYAHYHNSVLKMLKTAKELGFDMIEVSDGIIDLSLNEKKELIHKVKDMGFEDYLVTVGKKDPSSQLSLEETVSQLKEASAFKPFKVVLEGRETGKGVGIYDHNGEIKWSWVRAIANRVNVNDLIFEAPLETQQAALILEFGPQVNLGNVSFGSLASLESERRGLRFDTFGITRPVSVLQTGPATKFVMFVIQRYQPIDQRELANLTQLPKRTIQKCVEELKEKGMITEHPSFEDRRQKIYRTPIAPALSGR